MQQKSRGGNLNKPISSSSWIRATILIAVLLFSNECCCCVGWNNAAAFVISTRQSSGGGGGALVRPKRSWREERRHTEMEYGLSQYYHGFRRNNNRRDNDSGILRAHKGTRRFLTRADYQSGQSSLNDEGVFHGDDDDEKNNHPMEASYLNEETVIVPPSVKTSFDTISTLLFQRASSAVAAVVPPQSSTEDFIRSFGGGDDDKGKSKWNDVNLEIVKCGKRFSSLFRRFDGGVWNRDSGRNENVVAYLMHRYGWNDKEATVESRCLHTESWSMVEDDEGTSIVPGRFRIDITDNRMMKNDTVTEIESWEGDTHVTVTEIQGGGEERTERILRFSSEEEKNDPLTMVVTKTYTPANGDSITCREVFVRHYQNDPNTNNSTARVLVSPFTRVPGCIAVVNIRVLLIPIPKQRPYDEHQQYRVFLDGTADALLSRGLISLLSAALSGANQNAISRTFGTIMPSKDTSSDPMVLTAEDILKMNPDYVTDLLGLRHILSKGRNDGLARMLHVIQDLISSLLLPNSSQTTRSAASEQTSSMPSPDDDNVKRNRKPTVAMLLSGGVDSSVALNLLLRQNYNITAFYLKIWLEDELSHLGQCPWEDDYRVCTEVCNQANVNLEALSLQQEYQQKVMAYTLREAKMGRTPNPDIMCNSRVKFGCFYDAIADRGFDYVATGHYARLVRRTEEEEDDDSNEKWKLFRAPDDIKDQSYFLSTLTQSQLSKAIFPIGNYTKAQVRQLADEFHLPNRNRPDSQGLCFLGKVKFDDFLKAHLGECPGDIVDAATGDIIGRHKGLWFHTVGQRKGIGKVLEPKASSCGPWYIVAKNPEKNILLASNMYDEEGFASARSQFHVEDIGWVSGEPPPVACHDIGSSSSSSSTDSMRNGEPSEHSWKETRFFMKIRHGPKIVKGSLLLSNQNGTEGKIHLDEKDGGLAPGQFVVFYRIDDDIENGEIDSGECLGAGVISERHWARFLLESENDDVRSLATANV